MSPCIVVATDSDEDISEFKSRVDLERGWNDHCCGGGRKDITGLLRDTVYYKVKTPVVSGQYQIRIPIRISVFIH